MGPAYAFPFTDTNWSAAFQTFSASIRWTKKYFSRKHVENFYNTLLIQPDP